MYRPTHLRIENIISHKNTEYSFRVGEAVIIVGENLDDPSQKVNGTGKSAFIESMALAYIGTSIRDVKVKELITNGEEYGEVKLTHINTVTGDTFIIWRKFYAGTKSSECRLWLGEDEIKLSDINEYNKFIFNEIGISKEDFLNFFLITSDNYNPFLKVPDAKKKEIINRFSGADNIDSVFPFIQQDVDLLERKNIELEKSKVALQTKAAMYAEDLTSLEAKYSAEAKALIIEAKEKEIEAAKETIKIQEIELAQIELGLTTIEKSILDLGIDVQIQYLDTQIEAEQATKKMIEEEVAQLIEKSSNIRGDFGGEFEAIDAEERETRKNQREVQSLYDNFKTMESDLSKVLADTIVCPKCSHEFSFRAQDRDVQADRKELTEAKRGVEECQALLTEFEQSLWVTFSAQRQDINKKVFDAQDEIRQQIHHKNAEIYKVDKSIQEFESRKRVVIDTLSQLEREKKNTANSIRYKEVEIEGYRTSVANLEKSLLTLQNESGQNEIDEMLKKIEAAIHDEEKVDREIEKLVKQIESVKVWETNFKNFKSHVANQSISNIADYTNLFLQSMGTDISIEIEGYKVLSNRKIKEQIVTKVLRGGMDSGSYGKFSGGERGRIDICVILAIQELINLNCGTGKGLDLLIVDEIMDQVDALGLECIVDSLQDLKKTIAIISQNEINTLKEHTVLMQKKNGITIIV